MNLQNHTVEIYKQSEESSPVLYIDVKGNNPKNIKTNLVYGHLDKQPPLFSEWTNGRRPFNCTEDE